MIRQKFWNKMLGFIKKYAYFICTTINFFLKPKANFRLLRISQKKETADRIHLTQPVPVCLTDSLVGMLSLVPRAEWQMGICTTGFGSPSQLQDSKVAALSGMETRLAAKLLTQQEHGTSPWQELSSPRGAEHSFPSSRPALGDAKHHGGLSRLRSTPAVLHFWGEVCSPLPASVTEQKATLTSPCPLRGGSGVPKSWGGT